MITQNPRSWRWRLKRLKRRIARSDARMFVRAARSAVAHRQDFLDLKAFCVFVGYPRSGHTIVGSLLTAHPDAIVSHELDLMRLRRWPRSVIFGRILDADRDFARRGRTSVDYDQSVASGFQGTFRRLLVIGDKKGGQTSLRLRDDHLLLAHFRKRVGVPLRIIHVHRHPLDNIATISRRDTDGDLDAAITYYQGFLEGVDIARATALDGELYEFAYEDLVHDPSATLSRLLEHLGLEAPADYVEACVARIAPSLSMTRNSVEWSEGAIARVRALAQGRPYLKAYNLTLGTT